MNNDFKYKLFDSTECISEQAMFDYIDNKLTPKEQHLVEKHLIDCELCSDALDGLRLLNNRSKIASIKNTITEQLAPKTAKVVKFNYRILISVAAGLLLLLGSVFFFNQFVSKEAQMADVAELKAPAEKENSVPEAAPMMDSIATAPVSGENRLAIDSKDDDKKNTSVPKKNNELLEESAQEQQNVSDVISNNAVGGATDFESKTAVALPDANKTAEGDSKIAADETVKPSTALSAPVSSTYTWNSAAEKAKPASEKQVVATKKEEAKKKTAKDNADFKTRSEKEDAAMGASNNVAYAPVEIAQTMDDKRIATDTVVAGLTSVHSEIVMEQVEELPQFPGGESMLYKFIHNNAKWPAISNSEAISSHKIIVQFKVDKTGVIKNPQILKGINTEFNNEALRVIKLMPNWIPAKNKGVAVECTYNLPILLEFK